MSELKENFDCVGPGWHPILDVLDGLFDNVVENMAPGVVLTVHQVKEKFGGLRVYTGLNFDRSLTCSEMDELNAKASVHFSVMFAESMSFRTCEVCGKPGDRGGENWIKTFCPEHHKEQQETGKSPLQKFWEERDRMRRRG